MAKVEVVMPQMGESVMEGTVIEWTKNVGDKIEVDETLLEIATDKVDTEVPSPVAGILVEVLAKEGDTVEVGNPIAIIETDVAAANVSPATAPAPVAAELAVSEPEPSAANEVATQETQPVVEAEPASAPSPAAPATVGSGEVTEVVMPQMGESVMEGTIIEWAKKIGDRVEVDETLLEIATDKVDTEVPSPEAGTLIEIRAQAGDTIEVGQVIAVISKGDGGAVSAAASAASAPAAEPVSTPVPALAQVSTPAPAQTSEPAQTPAPATSTEGVSIPRLGDSGRFYSPLVRSIAEKEGIPVQTLDRIPGSGQNGRLTKEDLLKFLTVRPPQGGAQVSVPASSTTAAGTQAPSTGLSRPGAAPASGTGTPASGAATGTIRAGELSVSSPQQNVEIIKMDRMRKMIAEHMVKSKQTSAHVTTFADVDVTGLVKWREANKSKFEQQTGSKLTFTPLFVEAIIQAIREFPLLNSSVDGDEIHVKKDINFGLAVALGEGGQGGLIVPVIKRAQEKNLAGLAQSIHELAGKARSKTLSPDDLVGGTITLTNYGSVGNLMGTPIINQPQVAIIGTGVIEKRPVVVESELGDVIAIRHMMYLSMSYDHRIIDGAHGGAFLNRVKQLLQQFPADRTF